MAEPAASAAGTKDRGRISNSSNSTASSTAATGVPNTAVMPPTEPATSSARRSAADRCSICPAMLPTAPPVTMIGPSAPNGPPVPMLMADESGLRTAILGCIRLPPSRIVSIASGMPCPRMRSEPNLRHGTDDEPTGDRDQHAEAAEHGDVGTRQVSTDPAGVDQMGEQGDQVQQPQCDAGDDRPDGDGRGAKQQDPSIRREVTQPAFLHASSSRARLWLDTVAAVTTPVDHHTATLASCND